MRPAGLARAAISLMTFFTTATVSSAVLANEAAEAEAWLARVIPPDALRPELAALVHDLVLAGWNLPIMGILTAGLLLSTFYMKTMVRLRYAAIGSNLAFLGYGAYFHVWPTIILHGALLPLNVWRLIQIRRTLRHIRRARDEKFDLVKLLPFLQLQTYKAGDILFAHNDPAQTVYYIAKGKITLPDIPAEVGEGDLIGEVGIFAGARRRASSAICATDVAVYALDETTITTAFYQDPAFAFYLVSLVSDRLYRRHGGDGQDMVIEEALAEGALP